MEWASLKIQFMLRVNATYEDHDIESSFDKYLVLNGKLYDSRGKQEVASDVA